MRAGPKPDEKKIRWAGDPPPHPLGGEGGHQPEEFADDPIPHPSEGGMVSLRESRGWPSGGQDQRLQERGGGFVPGPVWSTVRPGQRGAWMRSMNPFSERSGVRPSRRPSGAFHPKSNEYKWE